MEAAQSKLRALPTIGQAGCRGAAVEALAMRDQFELFTYASFLLGVENPDPEHGPHLGLAGYYLVGAPTGGEATARIAWVALSVALRRVGSSPRVACCEQEDPRALLLGDWTADAHDSMRLVGSGGRGVAAELVVQLHRLPRPRARELHAAVHRRGCGGQRGQHHGRGGAARRLVRRPGAAGWREGGGGGDGRAHGQGFAKRRALSE